MAEDTKNSNEVLSLTKSQLRSLIKAGVDQEMNRARTTIDHLSHELEVARLEKQAVERRIEEQKAAFFSRADAEEKRKDSLIQMFFEFGYVPGANSRNR